jgi:hypothetical protein
MNIENYDLNIDNYNINDLMSFFEISNNYTIDVLENKKYELINKIIISDYVDYSFKTKFIKFLDDSIQILISHKNNNEKTKDNALINYNHSIVHTPSSPFLYSNPSQAFQGTVNPLERRIITKLITIDSFFRNDKNKRNPNNFLIQLPYTLSNVISMKLVSLELPRMIHSISSKLNNNSFKINLYNMPQPDYPDISITINIPEGNYLNSELVPLLNNYFNNNTSGLNFLIFDINTVTSFSLFYVNINNLNIDDAPDFYYELDFSDSMFGYYLGFIKNKYKITSSNNYKNDFFVQPTFQQVGGYIVNSSLSCLSYMPLGQNEYTYYINSEYACGVFYDNYIYIEVDDFNYNYESNTIIAQTSNSFVGNNILARITLQNLPDSLTIDNSSDTIYKTREYFGPVRIKQLQIRLINKYGKLIELINDFSLALEFNILYQP